VLLLAPAVGAMEHTNHQLVSAAGKEIASGFEESIRGRCCAAAAAAL
jgi:hypothetical protein